MLTKNFSIKHFCFEQQEILLGLKNLLPFQKSQQIKYSWVRKIINHDKFLTAVVNS